MTDELDEILMSDEALTPSSEFAASVMHAVRQRSGPPAAIRFPWLCFTVSLVAGLACVLVVAALILTGKDHGLGITVMGDWITTLLFANPDVSVWAAMALIGSLLLVRLSVVFMSE